MNKPFFPEVELTPLQRLYPSKYPKKPRRYFVKDDIPVGIASTGELVCLPKTKVLQHIGFLGVPQQGKSISQYLMAQTIFRQWKYNVCIANDDLDLSLDHNHKQSNLVFQNILDNFMPRSKLPLIHCYPNHKGLEGIPSSGNITALKISIPFSDFLKHPGIWLKKTSPAQIVGINMIKDSFKDQTSSEDLMKIIKANQTEKEGIKGMSTPTATKLMGSINWLFEEEIFDTNNNPHSILKIRDLVTKKTLEGTPLPILMKARVIPVLMTKQLKQKEEYYQTVFRYHLKTILDENGKNGMLHNENTYVIIDEINAIHDDCKDILMTLATQGLNLGCALIWAGQYYMQLHEKIRESTKTLFCFKLSPIDKAAICTRFALTEGWKRKFNSLSRGECIALTEEKFILYDFVNNKRKEIREPIRMTVLPSLSSHRSELN